MKRFYSFVFLLIAGILAVSCYDDSSLWQSVNDHESRLVKLETLCKEMNTNISSLQAIVNASQSGDYIKDVSPVMEGGEEVGYIITFANAGKITIWHGKDGKDGQDGAPGKDGADTGSVPKIGIKAGEDGVYYWTLNGEWLTDDAGNRVKAVGSDGRDGTDGKDGVNGTDGKDGVDGVTPQLKIEDDYWYVSYDNGVSWVMAGQATGDQGSQGNPDVGGGSMFSDIDYSSSDEYVTFILSNGARIQIPTWYAFETLRKECEQMNSNIEALQAVVSALQDNDYVTDVTPVIEDGKEVGYIIRFSKSGSVTIYHGRNGKDGSDGVDGAPGQDGKDGQDGAPGKDGENGKDGISPVIGVRQDADGVWYWTLNGEWLLDDSGNRVKAVGTDGCDGADGKDGADGAPGQDGSNGQDGITPLLKIENDYWYISYDDGLTWTELGKAKGEDGKDGADGEDGKDGADGEDGSSAGGDYLSSIFKSVYWDSGHVYFKLMDGTVLTIPLYKELEIVFEETEGITCLAGQTMTLGYTLYGADSKTAVECITDNGWKASVNAFNTQVGEIRVTAPDPLTDGKVLVFVSNGIGRTYMTVLTFNKGSLEIGTPKYYVEPAGGDITVDIVTDVDYSIRIDDNPDWIALAPATKAATRTDHVTFTLAYNPFANERTALVELVDEDEMVLETFRIIQKSNPTAGIFFADPLVEEICLANFDADKDSILTMAEAKAVTSLGTVFKGKAITSFNELQYFTGLKSLPYEVFSSCSSLAEIVLPKSLTDIGASAFSGCSVLNGVEIPSSVQTIGARAFQSCRSMTEIALPEGLAYVRGYTFHDCRLLKNVSFPKSLKYIENDAFEDCFALSHIDLPEGLITIGSMAFSDCDALVDVTLPEGLMYLNSNAFYHCSSLNSINVPSTVNRIGTAAFKDCIKLSEVILADGILTIGDESFWGCDLLETIKMPSTLMYLERSAFRECVALKEIDIPDKVRIIESYAFYGCGALEKVELPLELLTLQSSAFSGCHSLTSLELPSSLKYIGSNVFSACDALESITLPEGIYEVGYQAFSNCDALESIVLPESITSLGSNVFYDCDNLKSVTLPSNLTKIDRLFENCASLENVIIPDNVREMKMYSFYGCKSLKKINIPENVTQIPERCFYGCAALEEVNWPSGLTYIDSYAFYNTDITNGDFPKKLATIGDHAFAGCKNLTKVTLPKGMTKINVSTFSGCSGLEEIYIPETVKTIDGYAFEGCDKLQKIELPDDLTSIGSCAFQECNNLREFTCPELLREIPSYMLSGCDSLRTVHFHPAITKIGSEAFSDCPSLNELVLPELITSIPSYMCENCIKLTSITVPAAVTKIDGYAFRGCLRLSEITLLPETPPSLGSTVFEGIYPTAQFFVPAASLEQYKTATGWKSYASVISAIAVE